MIDAKQPLMGLNANELRQIAIDLGLPAYTGGQLAKWLYDKHVTAIDEISLPTVSSEKRTDAAVYDLQGRRVSPQKKGLYIINGKKVVIR